MSVSRYYSPLRYPGGKGRIANYIKLLLEQNLLLDSNYVEPYAGGASVAIDLLVNEYVADIHINDIDDSIYSFWHLILNDTDRLCEKIRDAKLTIEEWRKQQIIHRNTRKYSVFDVGFSAFYLNRTNRSGILAGGVIGGVDQNGKWKIGARFMKESLIKRIQIIADYKDRINLYNEDAVHLIQRLNKSLPKRTLYYLDPPYYEKGKELYVNHYKHEDHVNIANVVSKLHDRCWLVSYDNVEQIRRLYKKFRQHQYSLNYSASKSKKGSEVLIFSDLLTIPEIENPTNRLEVKKYNYDVI